MKLLTILVPNILCMMKLVSVYEQKEYLFSGRKCSAHLNTEIHLLVNLILIEAGINHLLQPNFYNLEVV